RRRDASVADIRLSAECKTGETACCDIASPPRSRAPKDQSSRSSAGDSASIHEENNLATRENRAVQPSPWIMEILADSFQRRLLGIGFLNSFGISDAAKSDDGEPGLRIVAVAKSHPATGGAVVPGASSHDSPEAGGGNGPVCNYRLIAIIGP